MLKTLLELEQNTFKFREQTEQVAPTFKNRFLPKGCRFQVYSQLTLKTRFLLSIRF